MPIESLHHTISDDRQDMRVAYFGGMLIHPVAVLIAMATTVWMIFCVPPADAVSLRGIEWFFAAMLLVIGGRYLTFAIVFGSRVFLVCGAALAFAILIFVNARRPSVA